MDDSMNENSLKTGNKVHQKVIIVFISCCIALGLAYTISKIAFGEMLNTVDKIATPNEKIRLVSKISRDILQLDQMQRSHVLLSTKENYNGYANESKTVFTSLDSLKRLYVDNPEQIQHIDSVYNLLKARDKLFLSYVQVRKRLVDNQAFSSQIENINKLIQNVPREDTTVTTVERKIKTTTIELPEEEDSRSFLAKLFGAKKTATGEKELPKIIHEEINRLVDSTNSRPKEIATAKIDQAIQRLEKRQRQQSNTFLNREAELTMAGNVLVSNMINILHEVEKEAMLQMDHDNKQAQIVVNQSVSRMSYIVIGFFLIMTVLIFLILNDIRKSNKHRLALEKAKEEAEYHSAAKQRFLSNMSHELRTPLQSIIGYTEQLKKNLSIETEKINVIYQASEHLLQIVNEVLDYNQINSGKFHFQQEPVCFKTLVATVIAAMQQHADRKGLKLVLDTQIHGTGYFLGDAFRLKQILFNIISNAIKFTEHGTVTLLASATDHGDKTDVSFVITDTGTGIEEKDIRRIFNEFEQANNFNSGVNFGSGLGLSIVKTLVDALHGEIKVESTLNKGTKFSICFSQPAIEQFAPKEKSDHSLIPVSEFHNTVWIVDDDVFILELCHSILSNANLRHECFSSPDALLNAPWDPSVSHILMDMRMPGKSGKELNRELRSKVPKEVKIIAFTAQALPEERQQLMQEGFDALLIKPFKEIDLLAILGLSLEKAETEIDEKKALGILPTIYDDPEALTNIMDLFIRDTKKDLTLLEKAIISQNMAQSELLFHRMAGRTAQLGQEKIAFQLRKCEIDARNGEFPKQKDFENLQGQLKDFIVFLKQQQGKIAMT